MQINDALDANQGQGPVYRGSNRSSTRNAPTTRRTPNAIDSVCGDARSTGVFASIIGPTAAAATTGRDTKGENRDTLIVMNKIRDKLHGYCKYYFGAFVALEILALALNNWHL